MDFSATVQLKDSSRQQWHSVIHWQDLPIKNREAGACALSSVSVTASVPHLQWSPATVQAHDRTDTMISNGFLHHVAGCRETSLVCP